MFMSKRLRAHITAASAGDTVTKLLQSPVDDFHSFFFVFHYVCITLAIRKAKQEGQPQELSPLTGHLESILGDSRDTVVDTLIQFPDEDIHGKECARSLQKQRVWYDKLQDRMRIWRYVEKDCRTNARIIPFLPNIYCVLTKVCIYDYMTCMEIGQN